MRTRILILTILLSLFSSVTSADSFENGLEVYGVDQHTKILERLYPIAEEGNVTAQSLLGEMYFRGEGASQNYSKAAKWFRLAAEQGDTYSQGKLGGMYDVGLGVTKNNKESIKWIRLAAEHGEISAQTVLGMSYLYGNGVSQDYEEAFKWHRLAAEQGGQSRRIHLVQHICMEWVLLRTLRKQLNGIALPQNREMNSLNIILAYYI